MWQEIHDKEYWNNLVSSQPRASFLQSWQWGEFQESLGREVRRLSWDDKIVVQMIKMLLPFGKSYWYIPRGPIVIPAIKPALAKAGAGIQFDQSEIFTALERFIGEGLFLRADPVAEAPSPPHQACPRLRSGVRGRLYPLPSRERGLLKFIPSVQAQCVRVLDIRKSADELLAAMHPKTRYNINLAQRKGVAVGPGNIDDFLRLNRATRQRDKFKPHPDYYYQNMTEVLSGDASCHSSPPHQVRGQDKSGATPPLASGGGSDRIQYFLRIWQASYQNKILASAIIVYFGDTAAYVHGASSDEHREVMSPHLLHWQIIKDAQARGFHYYDLGGVNPPDKNHLAYKKAWEGISRFKAGFGGEAVCYTESFDLIYKSGWYMVYSVLRRVKKFISLLVY